MSSTHFLVPRARLAAVLLGCSAPFLAAQAQTPPTPAQPASSAQPQQPDPDKEAGRRNQKIERIRIEDSRNTIDELRVGGRTQNITVQPKANAPAYQVMPNDERTRSQGQSDSNAGDNSGSRVWWDVFKF